MSELMERFMYGNARGMTPQEQVFRELTEQSPQRQRAMISLAKQQIETQKSTADKIRQSNLAGAKIIANEIAQQTQVIEQTVQRVGERISNDILFAANRVSEAVELLGDRLCLELSEIRWELAQQNTTLEKILSVLQKNRNNEACQLVQQGVRHYVNEEYEEAEARFHRALDFDTTDYQVLMNLGYIALHKNNASDAFTWFKKALSLPDHLEATSKSRTLWAIARLHYAEENYEDALVYGKQSLELDSTLEPKKIFTCGTYAALARNLSLALEKIEQAISLDATFFTTAVIDPDLEIIRHDILELLSQLSENISHQATTRFKEMEKLIAQLQKNKGNSEYADFLSDVQHTFTETRKMLDYPSYSYCLQYVKYTAEFLLHLQHAIEILPQIDQHIDQIHDLQESKGILLQELNHKQQQEDSFNDQTTTSRLYYLLFGFIGITLFYFFSQRAVLPLFLGIIGTVYWIIMFFSRGELKKQLHLNWRDTKNSLDDIENKIRQYQTKISELTAELQR